MILHDLKSILFLVLLIGLQVNESLNVILSIFNSLSFHCMAASSSFCYFSNLSRIFFGFWKGLSTTSDFSTTSPICTSGGIPLAALSEPNTSLCCSNYMEGSGLSMPSSSLSRGLLVFGFSSFLGSSILFCLNLQLSVAVNLRLRKSSS